MQKSVYCLFAVLTALSAIPAVHVQTPEQLKHGAEHEKLAYFLGKWVYEEEVKPTAHSRSGKYSYTESCEWFSGEFAILCRSYKQRLEHYGLRLGRKNLHLFSNIQQRRDRIPTRNDRRRRLDMDRRFDDQTWSLHGEDRELGRSHLYL
jgi:hypothetical protein